ncbi:MAG TPA: LysM peptidoglycan-binding domain-containing protein [Bacteroidales bacterium]|nr:LysM peptidoglycan-binding domain-containing protein [Bacteroidales bacterium]
MNIHRICTFIGLLILLSTAEGLTQEVKVERSEERVKIGNELYYIHEVEKGQTLYSISKAYNVSQRVIARENPDIFLGLRPGQVLKIPFTLPGKEKEQQIDTAQYIEHQVQKGQTLYSLSRQYSVSQETIRRHNPILYEQELKANQVVKIPREQAEQTELAEEQETGKESKDYIYHQVEKKETLYSLSKQYDVEISQIIEANEQLRKGELEYGTTIKIPKAGEPKEDKIPSLARDKEEPVRDTVPSYYRMVREYLPSCDSSDYYKRRTLQVGLFLPFYLEKNQEKFYIDSSEVDDEGEKIYKKIKRNQPYIYPRSENFVEFYEGVLMALDSLSEEGISVNLRVFDTAADSMKLKQTLRQNTLRNLDLIIGPAFPQNFSVLSRYARKNRIHIISPFSRSRRRVNKNPYLIQIYPTKSAQLDQFASHISNYSDKNMILVHTGDSLYYPEIREFKNKIFTYISHDTTFADVRFKEVAFRDSLFYLEQAMNKGEENVIVVPSEDEAFVTDVVTNLNTLSKKGYDMRVFGYSNWQDFVNIEIEYFYNINLCLFTSFHVDYSRSPVKNVIRKYRNTFYAEPSRYVFHGFDIGYYFLSALYRYGREFKDCLYHYDVPLSHSDYRFYRRTPRSGLENVSLYLLKYKEDLTIDRVSLTRSSPAYVTE